MAEELTRSLTMLAGRGVPRGAAEVLEAARSEAAGRRMVQRSTRRRAPRPVWVAAATFATTLIVLGGSLVLGAALRGSQVGTRSASVPDTSDTIASTLGGWWLLPVLAVGVAALALVVRNRFQLKGKENTMTTTIETNPVASEETPPRNSRWLVITVGVLAAALAALAAWAIYGLVSESETAATAEVSAAYEAYIEAYGAGDDQAFIDATTEDYAMNSFGTTQSQESVAFTIASATTFHVELVGDLVMMGEGPDYFVTAAERVTYGGNDFVGVSAYRIVETETGLKVAEHNWVGNL